MIELIAAILAFLFLSTLATFISLGVIAMLNPVSTLAVVIISVSCTVALLIILGGVLKTSK